MFPTMLSALGFDIEGHRLGLGVDLFSGEPTLAETMGLNALNAELGKTSALYRRWAEGKGEGDCAPPQKEGTVDKKPPVVGE